MNTYDLTANRLYSWFHQESHDLIWLTDDERSLIDPSGRGYAHLHAMVEDNAGTPSPSCYSDKSEKDWLLAWQLLHSKINFSAASDPYIRYCEEMESKFGRQGKRANLDRLREIYRPFYENAKFKGNFSSLRRGIQFVHRLITGRVSIYGLPPYQDIMHGTSGTGGGLPTMRKKGQFVTESVGFFPMGAALPDLPAQRHMRGKLRAINEDATPNVREIENTVLHIQRWLKTYLPEYFNAWRNPKDYLQPAIFKALQKHARFCMFDYEHCDEHFSRDIALQVVLPAIESLMTPSDYIHLERFIDSLFTQPIYWGDELEVGLHNLLSGQIITNFLETIFGVILLISGCIEVHIPNKHYTLSVCGDDLYVALIGKYKSYDSLLKETVVRMSNEAGLLMNSEKCATKDYLIYLRRVYYLGQPVLLNDEGKEYVLGAYPSILTLMQVTLPEFYMGEDNVDWFAALYQRLDNLFGSPDFMPVCEMLLKPVSTLKSIEELTKHSYHDWWDKLYGQRWDPSKSPAYAVHVRMMTR